MIKLTHQEVIYKLCQTIQSPPNMNKRSGITLQSLKPTNNAGHSIIPLKRGQISV